MRILILSSLLVVAATGFGVGRQKGQEYDHRPRSHHFYYGDVYHHHHDEFDDRSREQSKPEKQDEKKQQTDDDARDKVFYFAVGDDFGAYEFIDKDGVLKGFHIDLLNALCDLGGYKCHYIMDKYSRCWETDGDREYPGVGLQAGWYTACIGYWPYPRRLNSFNFTVSFTEVTPANMFWLKSRSEDFATDDIKGFNVGFINGWSTSKQCLADEINASVNDFESVLFDNHREMIQALREETIDLFLSGAHAFKIPDDIHQGDDFTCNWKSRGSAFMMKYGHPSIELINQGLMHMYKDGSYHKLCQEANEKYAEYGRVDCIN